MSWGPLTDPFPGDWYAGADRPSAPSAEAMARHMGLTSLGGKPLDPCDCTECRGKRGEREET